MNGLITIVSDKGWAVSRDAVLDFTKEIVETPEGKRTVPFRLFEVNNPYGHVAAGEEVKVSFRAEDETQVSYRGVVTKRTESRATIEIKEQINEYKQILERALKWQQ